MAQNEISRRAKANFPTVLLTLLSIVQALALELMWDALSTQQHLYHWTLLTVLTWLQLTTTFMGILLIWLIYSSLVMRFSWVPSTSDALFPFLIGIIEFAQIKAIGPDTLGIWFIVVGLLFAAMSYISQVTMRRARMDDDNATFFNNVEPANRRDHLASAIPSVFLMLVGVGLWVTGVQNWIAVAAVTIVMILLIHQLWMSHVFTQRSYEGPAEAP